VSLSILQYDPPVMKSRVIPLAALLLLLPTPATAQQSANEESAMLYRRYCASCHGASGNPLPAGRKIVHPADLRSLKVKNKTDEELFNGIAYGFGHKEYPHAFINRGLTRAQISALVVYVRQFRLPPTK